MTVSVTLTLREWSEKAEGGDCWMWPRCKTDHCFGDIGGCFTNVSRAPQNILAKIHNTRNHIYGENFNLKICTCAQSKALVTRTKFQIEILITSTICAIHKLRKNFWGARKTLVKQPPGPWVDPVWQHINNGGCCKCFWGLLQILFATGQSAWKGLSHFKPSMLRDVWLGSNPQKAGNWHLTTLAKEYMEDVLSSVIIWRSEWRQIRNQKNRRKGKNCCPTTRKNTCHQPLAAFSTKRIHQSNANA